MRFVAMYYLIIRCLNTFIQKVFYAIKDAVIAARKENTGSDSYFEMRLPATSERIRMYSCDSIAAGAVTKMKGGEENAVAAFQPQGSY
jgi:hypothetical protein